jgi:hypothetical protein
MTAEPLTDEKEEQPQDILGTKTFDGNDLFTKIIAGFCVPNSHGNDFDDGEETSDTTPTEISVPIDHIMIPAVEDSSKSKMITETEQEAVELVVTSEGTSKAETVEVAMEAEEEEEKEEDVKVTSRDISMDENPAETKYQKSFKHLAIIGYTMFALIALVVGFLAQSLLLEPKWRMQELQDLGVVQPPFAIKFRTKPEPVTSSDDAADVQEEASAAEEAEEDKIEMDTTFEEAEQEQVVVVEKVVVDDEDEDEDGAEEQVQEEEDESAEDVDQQQAAADIVDLDEADEAVEDNEAVEAESVESSAVEGGESTEQEGSLEHEGDEADIMDLDEADEAVEDNEAVEAESVESSAVEGGESTEQEGSLEHEGDEEAVTTDEPDDENMITPEDAAKRESPLKHMWGLPGMTKMPTKEA